jgi:hypothetical protein
MDINKTRLGLIYIFSENEKISKKAKLHLINFIEQADEHQLKVLVMDGEIVSKDKLDEQAREIVDDRFDVSMFKDISSAALKGIQEVGFLAAAAVGAAGVVGSVAYVRLKANRACKKLFPDKGDERFKTCLKNYMTKYKKSDAYKAAKKQKETKAKAAQAKMKAGLPK